MTIQAVRSKTTSRVLHELETWRVGRDLDAGLFRAFARETIGRVRGPFLAQHTPKEVLGHLEAAFAFCQVRRAKEVLVDVRRGRSKGVAVFSHMDDQPFIVDTIRLFLRRADADYWGGFHVSFRVTRDEEGRILSVGDERGTLESVAMLEADGGRLGENLEGASESLKHNLSIARASVRDFRAMTRAVDRFIEKCEVKGERLPAQADDYRETAAFLRWLVRENFVFMGLDAGEPLGIQTVEGPYLGSREGSWPAPHDPGTVRVRKSHVESPIHRAGRIDEVLVQLTGGGREDQILIRGMFTYRAVTQPSRNVPILRRVLKGVLNDQAALPGSFRYKGIANVFDSLPTEFLFTTSTEAITEMVNLVFESEQQQEVGVTFLTNGDESAFCLVSMPKAHYSDELRRELEEEINGSLNASYCDHGLFMSRYDTVLVHFYLTGVKRTGRKRIQSLTERIRAMATPWMSRLWHALAGQFPDVRADHLVDTYGRAFPTSWIRKSSVERAVQDIAALEGLSGAAHVVADVFEEGGETILRLYQSRDMHLTDILPVLDNLGLVAISSEATPVRSRGGMLHMDSFILSVDDLSRERLYGARHLLIDALPALFGQQVDDDPLNGLILTAGLSWKAVDVLRAYAHYLRQLRIGVNGEQARQILLTHPVTCRNLHELFEARFDPAIEGDRAALVERAAGRVRDLLRLIRTHDEDLVVSSLLNLIMSTVRTNAYRDDRPHHYLSFKLDGAKVREMKGQRPLYEIYVHARELEGVHLRFGRVARGGLRWSDRADYRTEVLGLVTTQQVKNVVIVPEGSKGGFFLRDPERGWAERRHQADRLYRTFIRGLLDVTDNVVDGETVAPPRVVCHDPPDPYLVVAADKGTAHLSDTANAVSEAYGFWLGDAFASGGSNGYDHKGVGITARGAWVLARRHFAELGIDPYSEAFTVVGVGDMGGDVFGNGLIESPHGRLLAAYNHVHIFLDPDPDTAVAFAERQRLFAAGRDGGWASYDTALISAGGGVFERTAKSVPLSDEIQQMFGITQAEASPEEVVRHIQRMEVDLFWSGGIGTYVKASHETHQDADDRNNDRARIDATELRCKVVGEGANLSFTQAARIEASTRGVRMNTDFIDNSAGVDMSDHEVNLKILLNGPVGRGELTPSDRNLLLHSLTDEVADLVLANNDAQGRQISRDCIRSVQDIFPFGRAIAFVEEHYGLDREALRLPSDDDLRARSADGLGLTRPELALISSHVKRYVFGALMKGDPKELAGYDKLLAEYFPKHIQDTYAGDIRDHMLADEIAMTVATTRIVADAGAAFVPLMVETTGRPVAEIADAYLKAQGLARAADIRSTLEELRTSVSLDSLYRAWVRVDAGCREVTAYWLAAESRPPTDEELEEMSASVDRVYELQAAEVTSANEYLVARMEAEDIPAAVSRQVLKARYLNIAIMVWSRSKKMGASLEDTIIRQLTVGRITRIQEIIDALNVRSTSGRWEPIAVKVLAHRFMTLLRRMVVHAGEIQATSVDALEPLLAQGPLVALRKQVDRVLGDDTDPDLATLLILEERVQAALVRMERADG